MKIYDPNTDEERDATQSDLDKALIAAECGFLFRRIIRILDPNANIPEHFLRSDKVDWEKHREKLRKVLESF